MKHYGKYLSPYLRKLIDGMSSKQLVLLKETIEQETWDSGSEIALICQAICAYVEELQQFNWLAELFEDLTLNNV